MEFAFISPADMVIVMAVALVVFGPKRLPEVGRQLGSFMREMRKMVGQVTDAVEDMGHDFHSVVNEPVGTYPPRLETTQPEHEADHSSLMRPYDQRDPILPAGAHQETNDEHAVELLASPAVPPVEHHASMDESHGEPPRRNTAE